MTCYRPTTSEEVIEIEKGEGVVSAKIDTDGGNTVTKISLLICDLK